MRVLLSFVGVLTLAYAGIAAFLWAFQDRLVYFPANTLPVTPRALGIEHEDISLTTDDGVHLHGWFVPAPQARATVLFLHGNGGNVSHRLDKIDIFRRLALNVFIIDYRGYGKSGGKPSEDGTYRDARTAWNYLTRTRAIPVSRIVIYGESLGAAVALNLAREHPPRALIVDSSFLSVPDLGAELYPWLPVRWLTRFRYDSMNLIPQVRVPILVIHSRGDDIVPFHHGQRLFAAANEPKQFLQIEGSHNEGFLVSGDRYVDGIAAFLAVYLR
jgi:fermentation-respiration switch protein FrsA (DUF1100 family)